MKTGEREREQAVKPERTFPFTSPFSTGLARPRRYAYFLSRCSPLFSSTFSRCSCRSPKVRQLISVWCEPSPSEGVDHFSSSPLVHSSNDTTSEVDEQQVSQNNFVNYIDIIDEALHRARETCFQLTRVFLATVTFPYMGHIVTTNVALLF